MNIHSYPYDETILPAMPVADINFGSHHLPGIRVASVSEATEIILGRNVINQIKIVLNGPANMLEIPSDDS